MSRTLFRYIFLDLFKVFMMASGALAGIMSFGGLLRPLTEHGLDGGQVFRILGDLMPAMTTYSLPIAALFATTVVYGRLAADNEIIACRASGISHLAVAMPALLLGLIVSIMSMVLLCFVVPAMTLDVEKTIYSNIAKIIATKIDRSHQWTIGSGKNVVTVFAQSATVAPPNPQDPTQQIVVLSGPMIVRYTKADKAKGIPKLPKEFWLARKATLHVRPDKSNEESVLMEAVLEGGTKFPRQFEGGMQAGIDASQFGPFPLQSGIREKAKFMNIFKLKEMDQNPTKSIKVKELVEGFIREEQAAACVDRIVEQLNSPLQSVDFTAADATYTLRRGKQAPTVLDQTLKLTSDPELEDHPIQLEQRHGDRIVLTVRAREARIVPTADSEHSRIVYSVDLFDCLIDRGGTLMPRGSFPVTVSTPMTTDLLRLENRTVDEYVLDPSHKKERREDLMYSLIQLSNRIKSEMHSRASFSLSCLILVMIGAALGMMFRSGNYLTAFALSVFPAILTIVLIVSGQNIAEEVPRKLAALADPLTNPMNPLRMGLYVIWAGNAIVLAIASALLWRLHRQ